MKKRPSYIKAAFLMPANLFALAAAGVASVLTGEPTPMLVALGGEALYLGLLSSARSFRRVVRSNFEAQQLEVEGAREVETLLGELAPSQREHYRALSALKDEILSNYRKLPGGRVMAAASEQRVNALLTSFLRLLATLNSYRKFLSGSDKRALETELEKLKAEAGAEQSVRLREVKEKRVEILQRRLQRFQQAEESREVVSHQLASIEDLLRLTHEQSIAIRDPESLGRQIDALSSEVQSTEETVREMERFMELSDEVGSHLPRGERIR
ncbi:MAG: hypothetical protein HYZ28_02500 [Myxococcales bacterium]|nr:hypothetical protein [Myxococcales bacterium]